MNEETMPPARTFVVRYLPVIVCGEFDSPIDALIGMHVPQDEAMDLVAAAWQGEPVVCVLAEVDGGRAVAAVRQPDGRWVGGNAFPGHARPGRDDALRQLKKLVKRGRHGCLAAMTVNTASDADA